MARLLGLALCLALAAAPWPAEAGRGLLGGPAAGSELSLATPGAAPASGGRTLLATPAQQARQARHARHAAAKEARRARRAQRRAAHLAKLAALDPATKAAYREAAKKPVTTEYTVSTCAELQSRLANISAITTNLDSGAMAYKITLTCSGTFDDCDGVFPDLSGARLVLTLQAAAGCSIPPVVSFKDNSSADGFYLLDFAADYDGDIPTAKGLVSSLTVTGITFDCAGQAAGFDLEDLDSATLTDVELINCNGGDGSEDGPALYVYDSTVEITDSKFTGNTGSDGGAVYIVMLDLALDATFTNTEFTDNSASSVGGAVYIEKDNTGAATVAFDQVKFEGNSAADGCGAIYIDREDSTDSGKPGSVLTLSFTDTTFSDNTTPGDDTVVCGDTSLTPVFTLQYNPAKPKKPIKVTPDDGPGDFAYTKFAPKITAKNPLGTLYWVPGWNLTDYGFPDFLLLENAPEAAP